MLNDYPQHSKYINLETKQYGLCEGDIRRLFPHILETQTWPNFPVPEGYAPVYWQPPPPTTPGETIEQELDPVFVDGKWVVRWTVRPLTEIEKADFLERKALIEKWEALASGAGESTPSAANPAPEPEPIVLDIIPMNP